MKFYVTSTDPEKIRAVGNLFPAVVGIESVSGVSDHPKDEEIGRGAENRVKWLISHLDPDQGNVVAVSFETGIYSYEYAFAHHSSFFDFRTGFISREKAASLLSSKTFPKFYALTECQIHLFSNGNIIKRHQGFSKLYPIPLGEELSAPQDHLQEEKLFESFQESLGEALDYLEW